MQFQEPTRPARAAQTPWDAGSLPGGLRTANSAGQQGNTADESDDHPRACNFSELGEPAVGGRCRNEENPTAVANAAKAKGPPTLTAVLCKAVRSSG